jgi:hypothetical protein
MVSVLKKLLRQIAGSDEPAELLRILDDDVFLVSYPRSGNTWMRHLLANLLHPEREWHHGNINEVMPDLYVVGDTLDSYPRPRIIKSHEPPGPDYPKTVYLYRDGRDVAVSCHNHEVTTRGYTGTFNRFIDEFLRGDVPFGPWHEHVSGWLFGPHDSPLLPVRYEDMYADTPAALRRIAGFLGIDADADVVERAVERSTFDVLQESVRRHSPHYKTGYRMGIKGGPGKWREVFTDDQLDRFWETAGLLMEQLGYARSGDGEPV